MPELKGDPGLPPLRGTLRCSTGQAAAQLARSATRPRAQTILAEIPMTSLRYSVADEGKGRVPKEHIKVNGRKLQTQTSANDTNSNEWTSAFDI